jgi:8-oxo-dGTP diphosphatase
MNKKIIEVVAAIIEKNQLYYVVQRPFVGEVGGKWEFPGGKIQPSESHQSALKREIKEELNCEIANLSFLITANHEYISFKIKLHFYYCSLLSSSPTISEHISEKWVTKSELLKLDLAEADKYVLTLLV